QRRQKDGERPYHRPPQRRDYPQQRRANQAHHRKPIGRRIGARLSAFAGPRQPGALPQHLGGREI
ncbi:uncharacterized protein METZ01_LOCUS249831, partial [marine metagenome]